MQLLKISLKSNNHIGFGAKPIPDQHYQYLSDSIDTADAIDIIGHRDPDNDAYGSCIALARELSKIGKSVRVFLERKLPEFFMQRTSNVKVINPAEGGSYEPADLVFVLDHNDEERVPISLESYFSRRNKEKTVGLDHHNAPSNPGLLLSNQVYADTSSKSTAELVYQFVKRKMSSIMDTETLQVLYYGFLDDLRKTGDMIIKRGPNKKAEVVLGNTIPEETQQVLRELNKVIPQDKRDEVINQVDVLSNLTTLQQEFHENLFKRVQLTENNKLAYVILEPDDPEWKAIGQDNYVNGSILNDFKQRLLRNDPEDESIPLEIRDRLRKIKAAAVFYKGPIVQNPSEELYKITIHSRGNYAKFISTVIQDNGFIAGGHPNRAGGNTSIENWKRFIDVVLDAVNKDKSD